VWVNDFGHFKGLSLDSLQPSGSAPVPLQARRDETIAALCEHFSRDHLTLEEFERRLDLAHRVQTVPELTGLTQDLPVLATPPASSLANTTATRARVVRHAKDTNHFVAVMGGFERRGQWQPAQKNFCYAFMGGVGLDFREALLPPGETEVTVIAIMGGAEIIVPPGLRVDCQGIAIMGGFDHMEEMTTADANAPTLKINGFALMGGVEITVRQPGESARDASRRRKEERRNRKNRL
jgi:hypothetical protein